MNKKSLLAAGLFAVLLGIGMQTQANAQYLGYGGYGYGGYGSCGFVRNTCGMPCSDVTVSSPIVIDLDRHHHRGLLGGLFGGMFGGWDRDYDPYWY